MWLTKSRKMKRNNLKERIFTIVAGLFIVSLSFYFYEITKSKQTVLETGNEAKVLVTKISHGKGTIKSIHVEFNGKEYKAGEAFGSYHDVSIGDSISILYKPGIEYIVLKGKKTYLNTIIFEFIIIALGGFFVLLGIFYKGKESKANKNSIIESITGGKKDTVEPEVIKKQIVLAYRKDKQKVTRIIDELLITKDRRVESVLDALFENHCFSDHEFITSFKKMLQLYSKKQEQAYLDVIKVFVTSEQVENKENLLKIKNLIESSCVFNPKIKNELLSFFNE
jgi:hypothetical protein